MWYQLIQQSWIFHEYFMNHVNSWIIHESFMNSGYKYSWNLVHELWFMNISRICLDACIFKNNLPIVHEQFMNLSSWTKYDCRSWIVHEYSWIVHEYSSSHEFHFAGGSLYGWRPGHNHVTERAKACARKWEKIVWRTRHNSVMSNHRRMLSGISTTFPCDARAINACTDCLNCHRKLLSFPCFYSFYRGNTYKLCQTEAQPNTIIYWEERLHPGKSAPRPMTIAVGSLSSVPTNGKPILMRCLAWAGNEC